MQDCRQTFMSPETPIITALEIIDSALQIGLVVDEEQRLLGTVTDGDIRRAILKGISIQEPVSTVMNRKPKVATLADKQEAIMATMRRTRIHRIPIQDDSGRIIGIEILDDLLKPACRDNPVLLMAGGLGSRLKPLTDDCPKPLLQVGGKPILQNIIENFAEYGFKQFWISVNYKAEMIKDYFQDGSKWGITIRYIDEEKSLGTAGALGLFPVKPKNAIIVMNGDLLTKVNFQFLLDFHLQNKSIATMCVREYNLQVPYGVVSIDGHKLTRIDEKPVQSFFVNAGIYVLEPEVIDMIPKNEHLDMTDLFDRIVKSGANSTVFPIREYWLDIGRYNDFERANIEFSQVFE